MMPIPHPPLAHREAAARPTRRAAVPDCPLLLRVAPRPRLAAALLAVLPAATRPGSRPSASRVRPAHTSGAAALTSRASPRIHTTYRPRPSQPSLLPPTPVPAYASPT